MCEISVDNVDGSRKCDSLSKLHSVMRTMGMNSDAYKLKCCRREVNPFDICTVQIPISTIEWLADLLAIASVHGSSMHTEQIEKSALT